MDPLSDLDAAILDFEETAPRSIGRGGVEKQVKALVVAHRGDIQLRTNSLLFAADAARRGVLEVQNGGV